MVGEYVGGLSEVGKTMMSRRDPQKPSVAFWGIFTYLQIYKLDFLTSG